MKTDQRTALYTRGVALAKRFLEVNGMPLPRFATFEETGAKPLAHWRTIGGRTGFYQHRTVNINVPVTALPVLKPHHMAWSWPGWKTDRTAVGVVAHEVGHHVSLLLGKLGYGPGWKSVAGGKRVSGYEPHSEEAFAESMRLFILNPDLLYWALPERYTFLRTFMTPSETRDWKTVIGNAAYHAAAERWISK